MIKVKKIIDVLKGTVLLNSPIVEHEDVLLMLVEQALSEIYKKFNLGVETETVTTEEEIFYYKLKNTDVNKILGIFREDGTPIPTTDVIDTAESTYKLINTVSFTMNKPVNGYVSCVYSSSPPEIESIEGTIGIPRAFETALIMYVGYIANTTVITDRDSMILADTYQSRYLAECDTLIQNGYRVDLNIEAYSVQHKGFV